MTNVKKLKEHDYEDVIVFSNPCYEDALIGVTDDNRAVYDFYKMVDSLIKYEGMSEEDAIDFISYNTIRSLPYIGVKSPIIMYSLD